MTRLDMLLVGIGGANPSQNENDKVYVWTDQGWGNGRVHIEPRGASGQFSSAEIVQIGMERARMLPHAAGSAFKAAPTQIYGLAKPIFDLSDGAANEFRRHQLPRVTGLEGLPSVAEMVKDFIAGARVPVQSLMPMPFSGPPKPWGLLAAWLWGRLNNPQPFPRAAAVAGEFTSSTAKNWQLHWTKTDKNSATIYCHDGSEASPAINDTRTRLNEEPSRFGLKYQFAGINGQMTCSGGDSSTYKNYVEIWARVVKDGPWVTVFSEFAREGTWAGNGTYRVASINVSARPTRLVADGVDLDLPLIGEAQPLPREKFPPLITPLPTRVPLPDVKPQPQPQPEPMPDVAPAPKPAVAPPATAPSPGALPVEVPVKVPGSTEISDGSIVAPRPLPVPTTPQDQLIPWPGARPIVGTGVAARPDLGSMARELGNIERKLEYMNGGGPGAQPPLDKAEDLWNLIRGLYDLLSSLTAGTTYSLDSPCEVDESGKKLPPVQINVPGSVSPFGVLANRLDALADLVQVHKNLRQPTCKPRTPQGQWVTVNFKSDEASPGGKRRLEKVFRYRDQSGTELLLHTQHWEHFVWRAGPWCVISKNLPWGVPQVWAESSEEGKRVIAHAAAIAGVSLADPRHEWIVTRSKDPRFGQSGTMRVWRRNDDGIRVSKRDDPSGLPKIYGPSPHP